MARLIIKNIGPLKSVNVDLKKVNVFIGKQSSGKSTLAKIVSFCTWLDKSNQTTEKVISDGAWKLLQTYSRLTKAYFSEKSCIFYEGDNVAYSYNWPTNEPLPFSNGNKFQDHECLHQEEMFFRIVGRNSNPKVVYIPAERNFVSAVHNLRNYAEENDNLQDFVNTWYQVKRKFSKTQALNVLDLGVKFYYSEKDYSDNVVIDGEKHLSLDAASSGLQSVIPLLSMFDWFSSGIYQEERPFSPAEYEEIMSTIEGLSTRQTDEKMKKMVERLTGFVSGKIYSHTQFIVEEPEQNLFPMTQRALLNYMVAAINHGKNHRLLITTHSPYVLNQLNLLFKAYDTKHQVEEASLNYDDTGVYAIENGELKDLKLKNAHLVDPDYLSQFITDIYDQYELLSVE